MTQCRDQEIGITEAGMNLYRYVLYGNAIRQYADIQLKSSGSGVRRGFLPPSLSANHSFPL